MKCSRVISLIIIFFRKSEKQTRTQCILRHKICAVRVLSCWSTVETFFPCVCRWKETLNLAEILHEYVIIRRFTKPKNRVPVYFYRHFHPFWVARISCGKAYLLFWLLLCCVFTYKDMSLLGCLTLFAIVHVDMTTKTLCTNNISLSLSLVPYLSLNSIEKESHCIRLNCCLNVCSLLERINSSKKNKVQQ